LNPRRPIKSDTGLILSEKYLFFLDVKGVFLFALGAALLQRPKNQFEVVNLGWASCKPLFTFYKAGVIKAAVVALSGDFFQMADRLLIPMACKLLLENVTAGDLPAGFLKQKKLFLRGPLSGWKAADL
jgi:hypothetical protein